MSVILPTKHETKTWLHILFSPKCFSKGYFKFYYNHNNIDHAYQQCINMPKNIKLLLYNIEISTKINELYRFRNLYEIIFYCDGRIAKKVITNVSEYLDYSTLDGNIVFHMLGSSKNSFSTNIIQIKKKNIFDDYDNDDNDDNDNNDNNDKLREEKKEDRKINELFKFD